MTVTREVVRDLWPVYAAGEASDDTRRLVDEFLAGDPELARTLRADAEPVMETERIVAETMDLPPNHEARTLDRVKARLRRRSPFRIVALGFTGLAVRNQRGEDLQGDGHGDAKRRADCRAERLGRRAHPGRRRLARRLC